MQKLSTQTRTDFSKDFWCKRATNYSRSLMTMVLFCEVLVGNKRLFSHYMTRLQDKIYIYIYASPPPQDQYFDSWQMFMCQSIVFHVDVEELQEFRR